MTWVVTAVVASAVLTGASIVQSNKAAKAQRKANDVNRKIEERQRKREQMDALRQAQIARAQAQAAGVNTGVTDSSGLQGQVASIQAQTASNVAFSNQVQSAANVSSAYQQQAADAETRAGTFSSLASLTMMVGSALPGKPAEAAANKPKGGS